MTKGQVPVVQKLICANPWVKFLTCVLVLNLTELDLICKFGITGVSLRLGAGGHLDLVRRQSLCKALKILKINFIVAEIVMVNLPGARPLMKPQELTSFFQRTVFDKNHNHFPEEAIAAAVMLLYPELN